MSEKRKYPYGTDTFLADFLEKIEARLALLEARVFPQAAPDGWLTNGYASDEATIELLRSEFGELRAGDPKPTQMRTAEDLKNSGLVGFYQVRQ